MVMNKIRIATTGSSKITKMALEAFTKIKEYEVVAIYSRSEENARALADEFKIEKIITDWEVLRNDPAIDMVYVASPNSLHYQNSLDLIESGKHVILEKPFVVTPHEYKLLMSAVEKTKRFCFDAVVPLHLPNYQVLKETINSLGRITLMSSSMVQYSSRYDALLAGDIANIFDPKMAGGALMDLGVYPLTDLVSLFGKPKDVLYHARKHENGIDLSGVIQLNYPDKIASCIIGKDTQGSNATLIMAEGGSIYCEGASSQLNSVILTQKKDVTNLSCAQVSNPMMYEFQDFANVYLNNDWAQYNAWMKITQDVIDVMYEARQKIGLVFPNDSSMG